MIGEVFGNYRVTAKLGEGGMGAVYLAEHPSIGRKVAVKMIRPDFSNDAETLRRFVREARSTATLRHPALVDIMDYGVHEKTGSAYIIMEYLEGESLDARLERQGALSPRHAADIARQIALGMAAAHRAGIIHRDLKPGNVHLTTDPDRPGVDVVKVLDFGIAKLAHHETGAGPTTRSDVLLGTPRYMAPEQCRGGGAFDHRVDIYSLGCLLYEAVSGRPPFVHEWPGELIAAHLGETPPPLRTLVPSVPEALASIVMRAIAKHPDHRQPTMNHVAAELEHFLRVDVSVPPVALGSSAHPAVPPAQLARHAAGTPEQGFHRSATTTASVVMRQRGGGPLLRRTLLGAALLVAGAGLIVAIATIRSSKSPSLAGTTVLAPAAPLVSDVPVTAPADPAAAIEARNAATSAAEPARVGEPPGAAAAAIGAGGASNDSVPHPDESPDDLGTPDSASSTGARVAASPAQAAGSGVRIRVANPRPGLRVTVDGRGASLPVRLPRDQKTHVLSFTAPNFKIETKTVIADQDQTLTLEYRPKLYVP